MAAAQQEFPFANITGANVVGIVHSHPAGGGNSSGITAFENVDSVGGLNNLDYGNTMPSHPNISNIANDWGVAASYLQNNGRSNTAGLSHYILGPDGVLRQYDYKDGHPAAASAQVRDRIDAAQKDAAGECS